MERAVWSIRLIHEFSRERQPLHCVDNFSAIKLYIIFHIEYNAIEFITNKKDTTITCLFRH